jgi:hypothetical protein
MGNDLAFMSPIDREISRVQRDNDGIRYLLRHYDQASVRQIHGSIGVLLHQPGHTLGGWVSAKIYRQRTGEQQINHKALVIAIVGQPCTGLGQSRLTGAKTRIAIELLCCPAVIAIPRPKKSDDGTSINEHPFGHIA